MKQSLKYLIAALMIVNCSLSICNAEGLLKSEYSYRLFTHRDGLPDIQINCLFQDSKGYIWLGMDCGLARYDGTAFHSVINDAEVAILRITETPAGNIEAYSHRSLFTVSPQGDYERKRLPSDMVFCRDASRILPQGYAIFQNLGMDKRSLYALQDTGLVKIWGHEDMDELDDIHALYWDKKNNRIYYGNGIYDEQGNLSNILKNADGDMWYFVPHEKGIWVIGTNGIYDLKDNYLQKVCTHSFSVDTGIYGLLDSKENLIIKDAENIYQYANGHLETIFSHIKYASDILLDKEDNLWVSSNEGLYCFFKRHFKNYILPDKGDVIRMVQVDKDDRLWLGSLNGQLIASFNDQAKAIAYPKHPLGNFFHPFSTVYDKTLYFNSPLTLSYADNKFRYLDFPKEAYLFTASLSNGQLVAASNSRLILFQPDGKIIKMFSHQDLFQLPRQAALDKKGRLWVTGMSGITLIDGEKISLMEADSLQGSYLITTDNSGDIWFNARNHLYKYENEHIRFIHTFENDIAITGLHLTKSNILVVTTAKGLYLSSPELGTMKFYNYCNGFTGNASFQTNITEDSKGNVYLLTMDCMVKFNPDELIYKQPTPLLYFQSMQSSTDNIHWFDKDENQTDLDYKHKNVKFNYIGICYSAIGNLFYQYRLKGFQEEWSGSQLSNEVVFNNLPPGEYIFELKAHTGLSETETSIVSIPFSIHPAFWQTAWFIVVSILTLLLLTTGIALSIQRRKNKVLFEHLETEKQLNELRIKSIRLKAIPHFNANVLAAIQYYIMNKSREEAMRILNVYSRFMFDTLREVDRASRSLSEELEYVKMYLELEKLRFLDKFDYAVEIGENVETDKVQLPNMILHTWAENAVKHGLVSKTSGGLLTVRAVQSGNIVCVSVEDNGVGRETAAVNKNILSSKQGLSILERQVEIYNRFNDQKIKLLAEDLIDENGESSGTRFLIEVPKKFNYEINYDTSNNSRR
ncbi:hypothetical protein FACS189415_5260 [Bacteroidia bacterium]|nr:hypothetical protein FACS189415_5260 [Bacteroidia bacterium]